jgi:hypothetical protein
LMYWSVRLGRRGGRRRYREKIAGGNSILIAEIRGRTHTHNTNRHTRIPIYTSTNRSKTTHPSTYVETYTHVELVRVTSNWSISERMEACLRQWYNSFAGVLWWRCSGVTAALQWRYSGVTVVSQ